MTGPSFAELFGREPEASASAHGRVNMIGDHTDYNEGFVLPIAIPQQTRVEIARGDALPHEAYSATLGERFTFDLQSAKGFARYVAGCVAVAGPIAGAMPPLRLRIASDVPVGIGLSSSAALEIATLRALDLLLGLNLGAIEAARLAQRAEVEYVGVNCGIMDQMAASLATTTEMLLIDTLTLETKLTPLPGGATILVVDSGTNRSLANSAYNERREECRQAARALKLGSLRDVTDQGSVERLPSPLRERARHVVSENARVLAAASTSDPREFGALMNDSHASLRDDYQVSTGAVDRLVSVLQAHPEVYGARMTGAGFGGACVALVTNADAIAPIRAKLANAASSARIVVPALEAS